jgi:hypothetical protein
MNGLAELLADCDGNGIRLLPTGDGRLTIDAPHDALTPEMIGRLNAHKAELLATLPAVGGQTPLPLSEAVEASVPADGKWHTVYDITHGEFDWINGAFANKSKPAEPRCRCHRKQRWWRSIYGDHLICGICHPPATPGVFREWVHEKSSKTK